MYLSLQILDKFYKQLASSTKNETPVNIWPSNFDWKDVSSFEIGGKC